jgi:hypothetical protein
MVGRKLAIRKVHGNLVARKRRCCLLIH